MILVHVLKFKQLFLIFLNVGVYLLHIQVDVLNLLNFVYLVLSEHRHFIDLIEVRRNLRLDLRTLVALGLVRAFPMLVRLLHSTHERNLSVLAKVV